MISFLIVLPENPENDPLHIFNGLYTALFEYLKWDAKSGIYAKMNLLCDCFTYLAVQLQEKIPYHVENVRSNDVLYREPEFKQAIFAKLQEVLGQINTLLAEVNAKKMEDIEVYLKLESLIYKETARVTKTNCRVLNTLIVYLMPCTLLLSAGKGLLDVCKKGTKFLKDKIMKSNGHPSLIAFVKSTFRNMQKNINVETCALFNQIGRRVE